MGYWTETASEEVQKQIEIIKNHVPVETILTHVTYLFNLHKKITYYDGIQELTECNYCGTRKIASIADCDETLEGVWPCETMEPFVDMISASQRSV